jgi:GNAT superfamily N-acetyltransferase
MNKRFAETNLQIIPCATKDAEALSEIAIRSYKDFYLYLWHDDGEWYIQRSFAPAVFEKQLQDPNHAFFLITESNEVIGFLKLNVDEPLQNHEQFNCLELERIYLIKSATGKGCGRHVVEFCYEYPRNFNKQIIWLKAMDSSDAVFFYEKLGFERCGSFQLNFHRMKKEFRGMIIMMKKIL